jgi:hypothetical protein
MTILPWLRRVFHITADFDFTHWVIAAGLALGAVLVMEAVKWVRAVRK